MQKYRRDGWVLLTFLLPVLHACGTLKLSPTLLQHPAPLVGEWIDVAKSSPSDTSLWILTHAGDDLAEHIVHSDSGGPARSGRRHFGFWYFKGNMQDPADRFICVTKRPGRSGAACLAFSLDSVQAGAAVRARLVIHGYAGSHSTTDRTLIAHAP